MRSENGIDKGTVMQYNERKRALYMAVSPYDVRKKSLAARVVAGRLTRFRGYVDHYRKDNDGAYQEAQESLPLLFSHKPHLPSQGSGTGKR